MLAALDGNGGAPGQPSRPLLEPLTERELAVLRFLPTMMSNGEIASAMFVSVNTVKTHLKHVYRKLDVANRTEAASAYLRSSGQLGVSPSRLVE